MMNRRSFLTSGAAAAALAGSASEVSAAEWTAEEKANVQVVNDFCAAWSKRDLGRVTAFFAEPVAYRMTETVDPIKGRDAVVARIKGLIDRVDRFEVLETFAKGPMVFNERIDRFSSGTLKAWRGVGVFFLKDGKIVEWYDYTISMER